MLGGGHATVHLGPGSTQHIQHWTQPVVKRVWGAAAAAVGWLDNGEKITNGTLLISRSPILLGGL